MVTVLSTLTLFLDCAGFLATGVVLGITRFPSVEVTVVGIIFFISKRDNFFKESRFFSFILLIPDC